MGKRPLCWIGFHTWRWVHTDDAERHEACVHCGKVKPELLGRTGPIV